MRSGGAPLDREDLQLSSRDGDENHPTDGTAPTGRRYRRLWNDSEDEQLRREVERNNLSWTEIAKKHERTECAVRQHWKQQQQQWWL
jgi:hypothetical protein